MSVVWLNPALKTPGTSVPSVVALSVKTAVSCLTP
jgi:hypothetical protein